MKLLVTLLAAIFITAGCTNSRKNDEPQRGIFWYGQHYYYVPQGYQTHCHQRRLTVSTPSGAKLSGEAAISALGNTANSRIEAAAAIEGKEALVLQDSHCHYGRGHYGHRPQAIVRSDTRSRTGINADTDIRINGTIGGGIGGSGRGGGSLKLP